jgi:hypothetical protein
MSNAATQRCASRSSSIGGRDAELNKSQQLSQFNYSITTLPRTSLPDYSLPSDQPMSDEVKGTTLVPPFQKQSLSNLVQLHYITSPINHPLKQSTSLKRSLLLPWPTIFSLLNIPRTSSAIPVFLPVQASRRLGGHRRPWASLSSRSDSARMIQAISTILV